MEPSATSEVCPALIAVLGVVSVSVAGQRREKVKSFPLHVYPCPAVMSLAANLKLQSQVTVAEVRPRTMKMARPSGRGVSN